MRNPLLGTGAVTAEQFSYLLKIAADGFSGLLGREQELVFQCYLDLPFSEYLVLSDDNVCDSVQPLRAVSFENLLTWKDIDAGTLRTISRTLKRTIQDDDLAIPKPIAGVLRFASIALAKQRCGEDISGVPRAKLAQTMPTRAPFGMDQLQRSRIA